MISRLLPPLLLHLLLLGALALGIPQEPRPPVPLAKAMLWRITPAQPEVAKWASRPALAHDLSGIVHVADDRYALVSDKGGHLLFAHIVVDERTGAVTSAKILPEVAKMAGSTDVEGCAMAPDGQSIVVSDEVDARLTVFPLDFGSTGTRTPLRRSEAIFPAARDNLSLESLCACADGSGYWTMNEDALAGDGPRASLRGGAWLRLQKVDSNLAPIRQWAYFSDPMPGSLPIPGAINGVADVLALPDGALLVLERGFGTTGFRARLYLVRPAESDLDVTDMTEVMNVMDVAGVMTDVTIVNDLSRIRPAPLKKQLLFAWNGWSNFEGIAFGPRLQGGGFSVLLVADDGDPISHPGLLALKLEAVQGSGEKK